MIHSSQVRLANDVFTPSEAEVEHARRILEAMERAQTEGRGAITLDGRLVDMALVAMARRLLAQADRIEQPGARDRGDDSA
jgi:malyl-CoA/(S)-citramalyl-CoA lyase